MAGATLRSLSLPRFALRRNEAAASLGISPSTFDTWVEIGQMPKGKRIGGVMLWDAESIRSSWQSLADADESQPDDGDNPFDRLVV